MGKNAVCLATMALLCVMIEPLQSHASDLINGVRPDQGHATGSIATKCTDLINQQFDRSYNVDLTFWNVGQQGGDQYKNLTMILTGVDDNVQCTLGTRTYTTTFEGGPNGSVAGNGDYWQMKLVDGRAFDMTLSGHHASIPVDNPSIFNGWVETTDKREDSGAGFSDLMGQVEVNYPDANGNYDEENWTSAKLVQGQTFPVGTHIKTFENSSAIISFADASSFTLKPESEIIISSARDEVGTKVILKMLIGNMWANIKKMAKDGSMQVEMSQAVAGIKGTTFVVEETGTTSTLKVIEGTVEFTSLSIGNVATVTTGQHVTATTTGLSAADSLDPSVYLDDATRATAVATASDRASSSNPNNVSTQTVTTPNTVSADYLVVIGIVVIILIGSVSIMMLRKKQKK
jgi:hypothetical protein